MNLVWFVATRWEKELLILQNCVHTFFVKQKVWSAQRPCGITGSPTWAHSFIFRLDGCWPTVDAQACVMLTELHTYFWFRQAAQIIFQHANFRKLETDPHPSQTKTRRPLCEAALSLRCVFHQTEAVTVAISWVFVHLLVFEEQTSVSQHVNCWEHQWVGGQVGVSPQSES